MILTMIQDIDGNKIQIFGLKGKKVSWSNIMFSHFKDFVSWSRLNLTEVTFAFLQFIRGPFVTIFYSFALTDFMWEFGHLESSICQSLQLILSHCTCLLVWIRFKMIDLHFIIRKVSFIYLLLCLIGRRNLDEVIEILMGIPASKLLFCWVVYSTSSVVYSIIFKDFWLGILIYKSSMNNF